MQYEWKLSALWGMMNPVWKALPPESTVAHQVRNLEFHADHGATVTVEGMIAKPFRKSAEESGFNDVVKATFVVQDGRWNLKPLPGAKMSLWQPDFTRDGNRHICIRGDQLELGTKVILELPN